MNLSKLAGPNDCINCRNLHSTDLYKGPASKDQVCARGNGAYATAIAPLVFTRECAPSTAMQSISEPLLAIVVQGQKEVLLSEEIYRYGVAQYLVVSVDLPMSGCAVEATPDQPYLGFKLKLDPVQLCDIIAQTNPGIDKKENSVRGWFISDADPPLIDCALRLTKLLETPQDIPFLAPMIIREIYYRLLMGEQGEAVRQLATSGSNMQRIAEVIKRIKADFIKPLRVEELAEQANMSPSFVPPPLQGSHLDESAAIPKTIETVGSAADDACRECRSDPGC